MTLSDPRKATVGTLKVYRITSPVRAVLASDKGPQLTELPAGSVLFFNTLDPNASGMVEGTSDERRVQIFRNDIEERCQPMNVRVPSASVRISQERKCQPTITSL